MIFDPNNPLSDEELDKLGKENFDKFLEYLDSKSEYLKGFTKPLGEYHTKRYAAATAAAQGRQLTSKELKVANCLLYTSPSPRDGLLSRMPSSA